MWMKFGDGRGGSIDGFLNFVFGRGVCYGEPGWDWDGKVFWTG